MGGHQNRDAVAEAEEASLSGEEEELEYGSSDDASVIEGGSSGEGSGSGSGSEQEEEEEGSEVVSLFFFD